MFRTPKIWLEIIKALDASPTPMSFSEVYTALQTGVIDGAENPLAGYHAQKFYEVCPHMILDGHNYPIQAYAISEITWNKLTDNQKEIIKKAGKEAEKYNREVIQAAEDKVKQELVDLGVNIVEVPDKSEWQAAVASVYDKFADEKIRAMLDRIAAVK